MLLRAKVRPHNVAEEGICEFVRCRTASQTKRVTREVSQDLSPQRHARSIHNPLPRQAPHNDQLQLIATPDTIDDERTKTVRLKAQPFRKGNSTERGEIRFRTTNAFPSPLPEHSHERITLPFRGPQVYLDFKKEPILASGRLISQRALKGYADEDKEMQTKVKGNIQITLKLKTKERAKEDLRVAQYEQRGNRGSTEGCIHNFDVPHIRTATQETVARVHTLNAPIDAQQDKLPSADTSNRQELTSDCCQHSQGDMNQSKALFLMQPRYVESSSATTVPTTTSESNKIPTPPPKLKCDASDQVTERDLHREFSFKTKYRQLLRTRTGYVSSKPHARRYTQPNPQKGRKAQGRVDIQLPSAC